MSPQQQQPGQDPFFQTDDPFFQGLDLASARRTTARGRAATEQESIQEAIDKLRAIKPRDETQRKRIEHLLASLETQRTGGTPRRVSPTIGEPLASGEELAISPDIIRGAAAGITSAVPGAIKTVASVIPGQTARNVREVMGENIAQTREFFDPRGTEGQVGEVAGAIAGGIPTYGPLSSLIGRGLGAGAGRFLPAVTKAVLDKIEAAGPAAKRAWGALLNAGAGIPLNIAQYVDVYKDAPDQAAKATAISVAADAIFGALHIPTGKAQAATQVKPGEIPTKAKIDAQLEKTLTKIDAAKASAELRKQAVTQARAEWQVANPGKGWIKDLDAKQRKALVDAYIEKNKPAPEAVTPEIPEFLTQPFPRREGEGTLAEMLKPPGKPGASKDEFLNMLDRTETGGELGPPPPGSTPGYTAARGKMQERIDAINNAKQIAINMTDRGRHRTDIIKEIRKLGFTLDEAKNLVDNAFKEQQAIGEVTSSEQPPTQPPTQGQLPFNPADFYADMARASGVEVPPEQRPGTPTPLGEGDVRDLAPDEWWQSRDAEQRRNILRRLQLDERHALADWDRIPHNDQQEILRYREGGPGYLEPTLPPGQGSSYSPETLEAVKKWWTGLDDDTVRRVYDELNLDDNKHWATFSQKEKDDIISWYVEHPEITQPRPGQNIDEPRIEPLDHNSTASEVNNAIDWWYGLTNEQRQALWYEPGSRLHNVGRHGLSEDEIDAILRGRVSFDEMPGFVQDEIIRLNSFIRGPEGQPGIAGRARDLTEQLRNMPKPPGHEGPDIWWDQHNGSHIANLYGLPDVPWSELTIGQKNQVTDLWGSRGANLRDNSIIDMNLDAWRKRQDIYGPEADRYYGGQQHRMDERGNPIAKEPIQPKIIKAGEDPATWWSSLSSDDRFRALADLTDRHKLELTDGELDDMATIENFNALNKSIRDIFTKELSPVVDVGRTVYEPTAAEQHARVVLPDDMKGPLMDLLIDGHEQHWDDATFQRNIDKFAAEHELTPEQVQQGLELFGHTEPSVPTSEPGPGAPTPALSPTQPTEPSLPTTGVGLNEPSPTFDYRQLQPDQLDALKEEMFKRLEANPNDTEALAQLNQLASATPAAPIEKVQPLENTYDLNFIKRNVPPEPTRPLMDPAEVQRLARMSPRRMSDAELDSMIDEVGHRIAGLTDIEIKQGNDWTKLMDKLLAERVQRNPPEGPLTAQLPPAVFGAAAGMAYGYFSSDEDNRASNMLMWAGIGALGAHVATKLVTRRPTMREQAPEMFPGQKSLSKIISYADERSPAPTPWLSRIRRLYSGTTRGVHELEYVYDKAGGKNLPIYYSAAKLSAIFGRWIGKAEYALTHGPIVEVNGEPVSLGALPPVKIKEMAGGDHQIENLDELSVARTVLEQMTKKPNASYPMDQIRAVMTVKSASPELHQAADALRKFNLAGVQIAADGGLVDPANVNKFASEVWYASLRRVFGDGVTRKDLKNIIVSPQPIKGRLEGSTLMVKSPFESAIEMAPKVIRSAEYNKIKQQFVAFVKTQPKDIQRHLLTRVENKKNVNITFYDDQVAALKALMPDVSTPEAYKMAISMGEEINYNNPHMTVYEDGVLRSYRINESLFDAFKSMMPLEHGQFVTLVGKANRLAAKGIVHNPMFLLAQTVFVEPFQAALQSRYGFVPYIDNIRGWWNIFSGSENYKKILSVGGVGSIQSLPYANVESAIKAAKISGTTPMARAINQIKEMHPWEAYKTIVAPFAEAARMGEAIRALNHGASTLEAAYAAWHVLGNTRMEGNFAAMRAFNLMTLFSRPAISALDELVAKSGLHPYREPQTSHSTYASVARSLGVTNDRVISGTELALKGFVYITLPSVYLWYRNKDDAEITQLRQTEGGQRYWFFRGPAPDVTLSPNKGSLPEPQGQIYKVRKPHVIGQMFGSTAEHVLDQMTGRDPAGTQRWLDGLINDAAFNMLPQIGVVPASLLANKVWGFGTQVVPTTDMETELQGATKASNPARVAAQILSPVTTNLDPQGFWTGALRRATTPAGFDFIINNMAGMLGQDALKAIDGAINTLQYKLPPAKDELPIIGRLYAKYPTMNTRNVRDFYDEAARVQMATNSLNELVKTKPELIAQYADRHKLDIALAPSYAQIRTQIADFNRTIQEMHELVRQGKVKPDEFKRVEREMLNAIILMTGKMSEGARQARAAQSGQIP